MPAKSRRTNHFYVLLSGCAFGMALLGMLGNLLHLQALIRKGEADPTDWNLRRQFQQNQRKKRKIADMRPSKSPEEVLRTLLQRANTNLGICQGEEESLASSVPGAHKGNAMTNMTFRTSERRRLSSAHDSTSSTTKKSKPKRRLTRFGVINDAKNLSTLRQHSQQACRYPPRAALCHVQDYSLVVLSAGRDFRTLFLNLISWLTFPECSNTVVLLPNRTLMALAENHENDKYSQRLWSWHTDSKHPVTLLFSENIYSGLMRSGREESTLISEAVVLLNGDQVYQGNRGGLQAALELWKRHASSLVASHVRPINVLSSSKEEKEPRAPPISDHPICQDERMSYHHGEDQQPSQIFLPDWSGLVLHRNFLCHLEHPVVKSLFAPFASRSSKTQMVVVTVAWLQLAEAPVLRLYPPTVLRNGTGIVYPWTTAPLPPNTAETKNVLHKTDFYNQSATAQSTPTTTLSNSIIEEEKMTPRNITATTANRTSKASTVTKSSSIIAKRLRPVPPNGPATNTSKKKSSSTVGAQQTSSKTTPTITTMQQKIKSRIGAATNSTALNKPAKSLSKQKVTIGKSRRRLLELTTSEDDDVLTALFGYFGSVPVGTIDWCLRDDVSSPSSCSIPWMTRGGEEYTLC